jgi:hypothetical protein
VSLAAEGSVSIAALSETTWPRSPLQQRAQGAAQAARSAWPAGAGAAAALTAPSLPARRKRRRLLKVAQVYSPLVAAALLAALCATGGLLGTRATHWHREARKLEAHLAAQRNEITHLQVRAPPRPGRPAGVAERARQGRPARSAAS